LYLNNTDINDEGLKHFSRLPRLQQLYLDETKISDDGLKHLDNLTILLELSVRNTHVTFDGVQMLKESLPNCDVLRLSMRIK